MAKTKIVRLKEENEYAGSDFGAAPMLFVSLFAWPIVLTVVMPRFKFLTFLVSTTLGIITYINDVYLSAGLVATLVAFFIYLFRGSVSPATIKQVESNFTK
jgi:hypothetical protein